MKIDIGWHAKTYANKAGMKRDEKNLEKAWDHCCVTDRKWWTQLLHNVDSVCTNRVHHFQSVT